MTQAFFGAGANWIVASLWSIDDESTAQLIPKFMSERARTGDDAAALRTAMPYVRDTVGFDNPYYWASFVLTGQANVQVF